MLSKITTPEPPKYKLNNALDNIIWVTGSVDGVIMAEIIVQITVTYFQPDNIFSPLTIPDNPKIIWIAGTWNARPVVNIKTAIKSEYWSKDQKGSTTFEP